MPWHMLRIRAASATYPPKKEIHSPTTHGAETQTRSRSRVRDTLPYPHVTLSVLLVLRGFFFPSPTFTDRLIRNKQEAHIAQTVRV